MEGAEPSPCKHGEGESRGLAILAQGDMDVS